MSISAEDRSLSPGGRVNDPDPEVPEKGVGGNRQVIMRTALQGASAGYWVRLPPESHTVRGRCLNVSLAT